MRRTHSSSAYIPLTDDERNRRLAQRICQSIEEVILSSGQRDPRPLIHKRLERQIYLYYMEQGRLDLISSVIYDRIGHGAKVTVELSTTYDVWEWKFINPDEPTRGRRWTITSSGELDDVAVAESEEDVSDGPIYPEDEEDSEDFEDTEKSAPELVD